MTDLTTHAPITIPALAGSRTAKAWRVRPKWSDDSDVVYAETAGKARYRLKLDLGDCCPDLTFSEIIARRASDCDRRLPEPHRIVADLSPPERDIIMHAYGASNHRNPGYRDHYCTAPGDTRLLRLTWELGIFRGPYGEREYGETPGWAGAFFYLTDFGRHVALSMTPTYR